MEQDFTVLENKTIGRNLYKFRKVGDVKASQIADFIGISEAAYTKYERGESKITIDIIQKVSEYLKVDPLNIIAMPAGSFFETGNNSPGAIVGNNNVQTMSDEQSKLFTRLIETQIAINEKIVALLDKK
jgi:transcriptional regulator with XRE-family HTH domain